MLLGDFIFNMKTYNKQTSQHQVEQKQKKHTKGNNSSQPNNKEDFYLLELRAVHGAFTLVDKDIYKNLDNCSYSGNECVYAYKSNLRSLFNIKSNYAHINWTQSKKMANKNNLELATTVTSYFDVPVSICTKRGYSKRVLLKLCNNAF